VTGGGSGIGEALCAELARRGTRVVVADVNGQDASRAATAIVLNNRARRDALPSSPSTTAVPLNLQLCSGVTCVQYR
jgi:NAD(P)-dependent dehydrogenase (short-subunit alcohol dehydrogenase family)